MSNLDPRDSDESPYEYDEPKKPLSPRRLANLAVVATGAVASAAFGMQIVGPAIAQVMYPSSTQTDTGSSQPTPVNEVSKPAFEGSSSSGFVPQNPLTLGSQLASLGTQIFSTEPAISPSPTLTASQIQIPAAAPSFGNLSSATPYAGSSGTWQSNNESEDEDEDEDDDDGDERKNKNNRDEKDDDDHDEDDD